MYESAPRILNGTASVWDYLNFVPAAGAIAGKLTNGLGIFRCFVGETRVLTGPAAEAVVIADTSSEMGDVESASWIMGGICIGVGIGGALLLTQRPRKRDSALAENACLDELFGDKRRFAFENEPDTWHPQSEFTLELKGAATLPTNLLEDYGDELDLADSAEDSPEFSGSENARMRTAVSTQTSSRRRVAATSVSTKPSAAAHTQSRTGSWLPIAWLAVWCLIGGAWFWNAASEPFPTPPHTAQAAVSAPPPQSHSQAIRDIRIGQRVLAGNPELAGRNTPSTEIDPAIWRSVTLEMPKADGGRLKIVLLRPVDWLLAVGAEAGKSIYLELPELGAEGLAEVRKIGPCPPVEQGPGRVVTGTFAHSAGNVIDVAVAGLDGPIGTTDNHPFWSEDRREFVPAGQLRIGESLLAADGTPVPVTAISPRDSAHQVYNLEVDADHVYHVSDLGILVHNSYDISLSVYEPGTHLLQLPNGVYTGFGEREFGQFAHHVWFRNWLSSKFPLTKFDPRLAPGQTGIDVTYLSGPLPGFRLAELKPWSQNGYDEFHDQVSNWRETSDFRQKVYLFFYDEVGNIWNSRWTY